METVYSVSFYIMAAAAIIFAVFTLTAKNIMHSVLSALISLFSVGLLIIFLGFAYSGAVQIAVCTTGLSILAVFAVMLTKQDKKTQHVHKNTIRVFAVCFALFLLVLTVFEMMKGGYLNELFENAYIPSTINTKEFAEQIFINYGAAFVFSSLAFLSSILGFGVILAEKDVKGERE